MAAILLLGCRSGQETSAVDGVLQEHHRQLDRLLEARDRAQAVLDDARAEEDEWYARQDSIFDMLYPDGPRPLISPFEEAIARGNAWLVVDSLDREITDLRDKIDSLEARREVRNAIQR